MDGGLAFKDVSKQVYFSTKEEALRLRAHMGATSRGCIIEPCSRTAQSLLVRPSLECATVAHSSSYRKGRHPLLADTKPARLFAHITRPIIKQGTNYIP